MTQPPSAADLAARASSVAPKSSIALFVFGVVLPLVLVGFGALIFVWSLFARDWQTGPGGSTNSWSWYIAPASVAVVPAVSLLAL